jgi:hypothetical protein
LAAKCSVDGQVFGGSRRDDLMWARCQWAMGLPWRSKKEDDDSNSGEFAEPKMKYTDDPCRPRSSTRSRVSR